MEKSVSAEQHYKKMTQAPVGKLIISLGIPTTISMLITNIYNMADSFFVSQLSLSAGGATSIVFGLMTILQAFGFTFGNGSGSNVSRALGEKDSQKASKYATVGFLGAMASGLFVLALGLIFLEPFMVLLGSTDTILPYAKDYAFYILLAAPFMTASCTLNNILRYEGRAKLAMIGLTTGGILNILLDPLLIFVLDMGIGGAGLATAISQLISFCILFSIVLIGKTESKISLKYLTKESIFIKNIIITGLPSLARQGLGSISTMVLNGQAKAFGDVAIAAMGYVSRTSNLVFSTGLGIGQGFQPVSGFNYGAKKHERVKRGAFFTLFFGTAFLGSVALVCFIFAPQIIGLFRGEEEVIKIGSEALRIYCIALVFFPSSVVATMLFQSIGKNLSAFILSCLQSGLIFIPLCIILPQFIQVRGIEISQPIAYFLSSAVALPMMLAFFRKLDKEQKLGK